MFQRVSYAAKYIAFDARPIPIERSIIRGRRRRTRRRTRTRRRGGGREGGRVEKKKKRVGEHTLRDARRNAN